MSNSANLPGHLTLADPTGDEERIIINVGGVRHETYKRTLLSIPGSRLANLVSDTHTASKIEPPAFFFDRSAEAFSHILNYYRTGKLHYAPGVCGNFFEEELGYWGISGNDVEHCCWTNFRQHRDAEEALSRFEPDARSGGNGPTREGCMSKTWALFDDSHSSVAAKVVAMLSLLFVVISLSSTLSLVSSFPFWRNSPDPDYDNHDNFTEPSTIDDSWMTEGDEEQEAPQTAQRESINFNLLLLSAVVELICNIWFSIELLVRMICCPNKKSYWTNGMNIIDVLAILPFYLCLLPIILGYPYRSVVFLLIVMWVARCLRLLRVFKMLWHYTFARALVHTLRASVWQFLVLGVPLIVAILIFSILVLITEVDEPNSSFGNILDVFWWAVITMTTVGYGDMYPVTWVGKVSGSLCALTGVLAMAMPIPILVYNFTKYYALVEAKQRCPAGKGRQYNGVPLVAPTAPGWSHS